jgi:DUF1680 family protein
MKSASLTRLPKKDILPGKHSNTQIPKIIASARRYELTGDKKDKAIADFFWETIVNHNHSYATGGNSNYEYLSDPDKLNDKLTENTTETCNTYNMLKLNPAFVCGCTFGNADGLL